MALAQVALERVLRVTPPSLPKEIQMQRMLTTLAIMTATIGCASTPDVREERMEAIETHADTHVSMADEQEEIQDEYIEQTAEMSHGKTEVAEERTLYLSEAETRLEKVSIRMKEAKAKAKVGGTPVATDFNDKFDIVQTQYDLAEQELEQLTEVPTDHWELAKERMNEKLSLLEDRVDELVDQAPTA